MKEYKSILKKVGIALIIVGIFDILVMIYCIVNQLNYSSSLNIFAVIAGFFLYRGGLKTAKVVIFFSSFFVTGIIGIPFILPLLTPTDLILTQIKLNPINSICYFAIWLVFLFFLIWILKSLTSPAVYNAIYKKGKKTKLFFTSQRLGIFLGIVLLATLGTTLPSLLKGENAKMAIAEAQKKIGNGYKFSISSINISSNYGGKTNVYAVVTAYNDTEIKNIEVQFEK